MKGTSILAKACAAALLCTGATWAQTSSGVLDSSKLDDKKITNQQGQELGEIERLLVDPQTGQVRFAVVEVESPGQAEKEFAVPWQALKVQREGEKDFKIQLDADKEKLEKAPQFSEGDADRLFTPEGANPVISYWTTGASSPQPPSSSSTTPPSTSGQQVPPSTSGAITPPQSGQPSVSTPSEPSGTSTAPGTYYQENRQRMEPSSSGQNNYPAGQQPDTSSSVTTPDVQSSSPATVPSPGASSPSDPSKDRPDISTGAPSTPSTPSEPSTIP